jgi:hypothetical protein
MKYRLPEGASAYWRKGKFYLAGMVVDLPAGVNPRADMEPVEEATPEEPAARPRGRGKKA